MAKAKPRAKAKAKTRAKPASRRAPARKPARKAAARKTKPAQRFSVSHHNEADFETGLRTYAAYRDLGIAAATNGMVRAHVIRMIPPCIPAEVSQRHYHDVEFQMVYVLKGWMKTHFEGQGEVTFRQGTCWLQPPKIKHTVMDYSDDCEVLEIILPADFETVAL